MLHMFSCIYIVECSELGEGNNEKAIGGRPAVICSGLKRLCE